MDSRAAASSAVSSVSQPPDDCNCEQGQYTICAYEYGNKRNVRTLWKDEAVVVLVADHEHLDAALDGGVTPDRYAPVGRLGVEVSTRLQVRV